MDVMWLVTNCWTQYCTLKIMGVKNLKMFSRMWLTLLTTVSKVGEKIKPSQIWECKGGMV